MNDETEVLAEEEATPLEPPIFSVNTVINADIQMEVSKALTGSRTKIINFCCFALVAVAAGVLLWQYIVTKSTMNLVMLVISVLALAYLVYSYFALPKRALGRWEEAVLRDYGQKELHLCTEFYRLTLAQTMQEDGSVVVQGYSELIGFCESERLFLLRRSKQQWFFISKEGFTKGTPEEFRKFISERVK